MDECLVKEEHAFVTDAGLHSTVLRITVKLHTDSVEAFPELVSESQVRQKVLSHCTVVRYPGIMAACIQQAV